MPSPNSLALMIPRSQRSYGRTDCRTWLDICIGSETLPTACYILSDESSIRFYSTSNGYKNTTSNRDVHHHPSWGFLLYASVRVPVKEIDVCVSKINLILSII